MLDMTSNVAISYDALFGELLSNIPEDQVADLIIDHFIPAMDPEALERVVAACKEDLRTFYPDSSECSCEQDECDYCDCDCHDGQVPPNVLDQMHACTHMSISVADMVMRIKENAMGWKTDDSNTIIEICDNKLIDILEAIE